MKISTRGVLGACCVLALLATVAAPAATTGTAATADAGGTTDTAVAADASATADTATTADASTTADTSATADGSATIAAVESTASGAVSEHPTAERDGADVALSVPADRVDADGPAALTVGVPGANGTVEAVADRVDGRYVARVPVVDLLGPADVADRSNATVRASHDGATVLSDAADLRYVASSGRPTFRGTNLTLPVDLRGVGEAGVDLSLAGHDRHLDADRDGWGPNATLSVPAEALRGLPVTEPLRATVVVGGEAVPGQPLSVAVGAAAARASALAYRDGRLVVEQPLLHPAIGPERVGLRIDTGSPSGTFLRTGADPSGTLPVPDDLLGASGRRVTVTGGGTTLVSSSRLSAPGRPTVPLRIEDGHLLAPDPGAVDGYDAVVLRADRVATVPIEDALRAGDPQPLPAGLTTPGETGAGGSSAAESRVADAVIGESATAILVGEDARPARVDLTVVVPEETPEPTGPEAPDATAFVGLWADVGAGVALLVFAMVGAVVAVGVGFVLRVASPARTGAAGGRAVLGHFILGGAGGVGTIVCVQTLWTGPVVGTVQVAGLQVGIGALLVGSFHGGLTAVGLRVGLGTAGLWPTRSIVGQTVPVYVHVADDGGNPVPGDPTVAVQPTGSASVLTTADVEETTAELALPPGEYRALARTGQREVGPVEVAVPEPETTRPEPREVDLTVGRPGLIVELTDAATDRSLPDASVTVTTDRGETRSVAAEAGSARVALPLATGAVTVVVDAERYERTAVEQPIDEELTTLDVAVPPATGTVLATALVDDEPMPGVDVHVRPAEDDPPQVGERTADLETGDGGRATVELPAGAYRLALDLEGPNAGYFEVADTVVEVDPGERVEVAVHSRFDWTIPERHRRRAARIRETVESVGAEATADPTIPLYFAGIAEAMLELLAALPASGPLFVDSTHDPDAVAAATVDAAGRTLQAVGRAMQAEGVAPVLAAGGQPERIRPDVEATPTALLAHLGEDVTVATVESRATRVRERIDEEAQRLPTVAPARAVASVAVRLPQGAEGPRQVATREFAAVRLLDAVEQCFDRPEIRRRFAGAPPAADESDDAAGDDATDGEPLEEAE